MVKIEDVTLDKEIAYGFYGTIYKVHDVNKNIYALKTEHYISKEDHEKEINFAKEMSSKYPDHFMTLYDYQYVDKCDHTQKYPFDPKILPKKTQKHIKRLAKSDKCISKLYTYIDTDLQHYTFDNKYETYSIIVQLLYIMELISKHKYAYIDLHSGNVGLKYTTKEFITIHNQKIPTYGKLVYLIDYGAILHKPDLKEYQKYSYNDFEKNKYGIVFNMFYSNDFMKYLKNNGINFNWMVELKKFSKMPVYEILMKITDDMDFAYFLYQHLYPEEFQKGILKDKFKKVIEDKMYVPLSDFIFVLGTRDERVIDYYINLLKN